MASWKDYRVRSSGAWALQIIIKKRIIKSDMNFYRSETTKPACLFTLFLLTPYLFEHRDFLLLLHSDDDLSYLFENP